MTWSLGWPAGGTGTHHRLSAEANSVSGTKMPKGARLGVCLAQWNTVFSEPTLGTSVGQGGFWAEREKMAAKQDPQGWAGLELQAA